MTLTLRLTQATADDIAAAFTYYEAQRAGLGEEFRLELNFSFALLLEFSHAGPLVHRDLRRLLVRRFPYAIYYRLTDTAIEIRGCLHLRQRPQLWRGRATGKP